MRKKATRMSRNRLLVTALAALALLAGPALADPVETRDREQWFSITIPDIVIPGIRTIPGRTLMPDLMPWMSPEIEDAWAEGYLGQRTTMTVIDNFRGDRLRGDLGFGNRYQTHGAFTRQQIDLLAPKASLRSHDFSNGRSVRLRRTGLNVLNLSYGMFAADGYADSQIRWGAREGSVIRYAQDGDALVVKAAGNDAVAVGEAARDGYKDYLASGLIGAQAAIFVGALETHGSVEAPSSVAWYSNVAGENERVQDQFLMVGVMSEETGLYGTSFAAPQVSGYAAVLGSKFTTATPAQIADRLLDTARTDTISGYDRAIHGRGEASVARAIAPVSIQ
jgi:hypothetical protein